MRIAIFFPRLKTFSGAEHLLLEFSRHAVEQGHEVVLLTRRVDDACRSRLHPDVEVKVPRFLSALTGHHLVDSLFDTLFSPFLLRHLPRECDVLCFWCSPVLPAMWLYKKVLRGRVRAVYYCLQPPRFAYDLMAETIEANRPLGYLIPAVAVPYRVMDRIAALSCDRLFAISEDYARWCAELYGTTTIQLVYPGVDLNIASAAHSEEVRPKHGFGPKTKLVVTVNKLIARKNVDVFLRAMSQVVARIPATRGVVVGDGPVRQSLLKIHEELGLGDKVAFTGFIPDFRDVTSYFAACDVYVFLERNVPFGLTVLEAAACGKPVVAVAGGGTRETLVDGETGFLISEDLDVDEITDKICWLLEHGPERRAMGARGLEHARQFSYESTSQKFVAALAEAAGLPLGDRR